MPQTEADLLAITPEVSDRKLALMIADVAVSFAAERCAFGINHDTRPPKLKPCPLHYDWVLKDRVGIENTPRHVAREWLTRALMRGYRIEPVDPGHKPTGKAWSIETVRRRAAVHQMPKGANDDDIPF